jgi:hypothetical protein
MARNFRFGVGRKLEHSREMFLVHWSPTDKETFVSSSWDTTLKIVRFHVAKLM